METYYPPSDKSITIRALLLGSIADGRTVIKRPLICDDTVAAINCLKVLGIRFKISEDNISVEGCGLRGLNPPLKALNAGEAGAVARLLAGLLAGQTFPSKITGAPSLRRRPMGRVAKPLNLMGASLKTYSGKLPLEIKSASLKGIKYTMPVASAQVKSAILLAGLYADGMTVIKEIIPSRDHTERLLKYFGARLSRHGRSIMLKPGNLKGRNLSIPGDISAAAPFIAAALLSGRKLLVKNVGLNPTRMGMIRTLKKMGAVFKTTVKIASPDPMGDLLVLPSKINGAIISEREVPAMIDELPLLAVIAAAIGEKTLIKGVAELRHKESDRIKSTMSMLESLGARAIYREGALEIQGQQRFRDGKVNTFKDHRIAMAAAVASTIAEGHVKIRNPNCVNKSYPGFWKDFGKIFLCLQRI
ncbi:MAG: 3-phosphoshikimate 1-carboxyvinyltransferase [Elusimicrobia bacterium]|nr:3-phosphoshikimate 1-carboxyvinyltransferase [Elusimicrobiota bacterium]